MYWKDSRLRVREESLPASQPYLHLDSRYLAPPCWSMLSSLGLQVKCTCLLVIFNYIWNPGRVSLPVGQLTLPEPHVECYCLLVSFSTPGLQVECPCLVVNLTYAWTPGKRVSLPAGQLIFIWAPGRVFLPVGQLT